MIFGKSGQLQSYTLVRNRKFAKKNGTKKDFTILSNFYHIGLSFPTSGSSFARNALYDALQILYTVANGIITKGWHHCWTKLQALNILISTLWSNYNNTRTLDSRLFVFCYTVECSSHLILDEGRISADQVLDSPTFSVTLRRFPVL